MSNALDANRRSEWLALRGELRSRGRVLGALLAPMWLSETVDAALLGGRLDAFGIRPRTLDGLWGIAFAPFLHGGFRHLVANTVPLLVLGFVIMLRRKRDLALVAMASVLVAGVGTWLIGATNSSHIGASSVVFGFLGYLLARGWYERSVGAVACAVLVFFFYGGALWGVLPGQPGISWEGHLFGFIGGVLASKWMARWNRGSAATTKV